MQSITNILMKCVLPDFSLQTRKKTFRACVQKNYERTASK